MHEPLASDGLGDGGGGFGLYAEATAARRRYQAKLDGVPAEDLLRSGGGGGGGAAGWGESRGAAWQRDGGGAAVLDDGSGGSSGSAGEWSDDGGWLSMEDDGRDAGAQLGSGGLGGGGRETQLAALRRYAERLDSENGELRTAMAEEAQLAKQAKQQLRQEAETTKQLTASVEKLRYSKVRVCCCLHVDARCQLWLARMLTPPGAVCSARSARPRCRHPSSSCTSISA